MGAYTQLYVLLSLITLATTLWKNQHRRVFVYNSNSIISAVTYTVRAAR